MSSFLRLASGHLGMMVTWEDAGLMKECWLIQPDTGDGEGYVSETLVGFNRRRTLSEEPSSEVRYSSSASIHKSPWSRLDHPTRGGWIEAFPIRGYAAGDRSIWSFYSEPPA